MSSLPQRMTGQAWINFFSGSGGSVPCYSNRSLEIVYGNPHDSSRTRITVPQLVSSLCEAGRFAGVSPLAGFRCAACYCYMQIRTKIAENNASRQVQYCVRWACPATNRYCSVPLSLPAFRVAILDVVRGVNNCSRQQQWSWPIVLSHLGERSRGPHTHTQDWSVKTCGNKLSCRVRQQR